MLERDDETTSNPMLNTIAVTKQPRLEKNLLFPVSYWSVKLMSVKGNNRLYQELQFNLSSESQSVEIKLV